MAKAFHGWKSELRKSMIQEKIEDGKPKTGPSSKGFK